MEKFEALMRRLKEVRVKVEITGKIMSGKTERVLDEEDTDELSDSSDEEEWAEKDEEWMKKDEEEEEKKEREKYKNKPYLIT